MPTARRFLVIVLVLLSLTPATLFAQTVEERKDMQMSATIPADENDFEVGIVSLTPGLPFPLNTEIEYEITYGSTLTNSVKPFKVVATWSRGTINGESSPSVDVLTYVVGSGTDAYDSTAPVIDTTNRTVTWDIDTFPADTQDQTVRFKLKTTNASYSGDAQVNFYVAAHIEGPGVVTDESIVTQSSRFPASTSSPSTSSSGQSSGSTGTGANATPAPTSTQPEQAFGFERVDMQTVSAEDAGVSVLLNKPGTIRLSYGTSPSAMHQTIRALTADTGHTIRLPDLTPETVYYFRITANDTSGKQSTSDIYTFTTAGTTVIPGIDREGLIIVSQDVFLYSPELYEKGKNPYLIMPRSVAFKLQFGMTKNTQIQRIQAYIRQKQILGLNTFSSPVLASGNTVDMTEIKPGVFSGRLATPEEKGLYTVIARIYTTDGGITEDLITDIRVASSLTVLEEKSRAPVEGAHVYLSVYNPRRKAFEPLLPQNFAFINPGNTDRNGELHLTLPYGRYKAAVSSIGMEQRQVEFTIGRNEKENYPTVLLTRTPVSPLGLTEYYLSTLSDFFSVSQAYIVGLASSIRFFDLTSFFILSLFFFLLLRSASLRLGTPWYRIPALVIHPHELTARFHNTNTTISGRVADSESEKGISGAYVFVYRHGNELLASTRSDSRGGFRFRNLPAGGHRIVVSKNGYHSLHVFRQTHESVQLSLTKSDTYHTITDHIWHTAMLILGASFETLLLMSLIAEIFFGLSFGWLTAAPFLVISALNLLLWLSQHSHGTQESTTI